MWLAEKYVQEQYSGKCKDMAFTWDNNFKNDIRYNTIVGMPSKEQGDIWFDFLKDKVSQDIFKKCIKNDIYPSPAYSSCDIYGNVSASTLRYMYSAYDITCIFGKNLNIVGEIGVGFGGLCNVLSIFNKIEKYKFYDLPEVVSFATEYNKKLDNTNIVTEDKLIHDVLISEFCFSEFDDILMKEYYNNVILNSKNIYLLMNLHDIARKDKWIEIIKKDFDIIIKDEFPKSRWDNYVIYGSKK
jgi:hypothetical protein